MTTIEFKQPQRKETETAVGEIQIAISTPDIQIITTEQQNSVPFSKNGRNGRRITCTFQVAAAVNYKWKPKLTASATYTQEDEFSQDANCTHSCTTEENATANSWTVKFTPRPTSRYTIALQVNGKYGGTGLHKTSEYSIDAHRQHRWRARRRIPDNQWN